MCEKFEDNEEKYLDWLNAHPEGYVLNTDLQKKDNLVLHKANCNRIRFHKNSSSGAPFTGGRYIKICANSKLKIQSWITKNNHDSFHECRICHPGKWE